MVKEDIIKKSIIKKTNLSKDEVQQALIDNFISMQKVMANLTVKFDELSNNMSKLLGLFEISAKTFAEKYSGEAAAPSNLIDSTYIKKLDTLLDQNKIISQGILLIEEKLRATSSPENNPYPAKQQPYQQQPSNLPSMQQDADSPYKREIGARQDLTPKPLPKY
jgi:hypothetical protein